MAIDWTAVNPSDLVGISGLLEYRVENDGLVRWRGSLTKTGVGAGSSYLLTVPVAARINPNGIPMLFDAAGGDTHRNVIIDSPTAMYLLFYNASGSIVDVTGLLYQGTPPPSSPIAHSLANVQIGLANALKTIAGLRVYDFPSDRIETPAAVLSMPETPYDVTLSGRADEWTFPLWVLVSRADDKSSYAEMTAYLEAEGTKSIRAAIEADTTLGGACDTASVIRARPLFATVGGTDFLAVEFTLEVYA